MPCRLAAYRHWLTAVICQSVHCFLFLQFELAKKPRIYGPLQSVVSGTLFVIQLTDTSRSARHYNVMTKAVGARNFNHFPS
jgi:hypothetical protein